MAAPNAVHTLTSVQWSDDAESTLITFYRENDVMWNPKHPLYYKSDHRNALLTKLSVKLKEANLGWFNVTEIKNKFAKLRTSFARQHKAVTQSKTGQEYTYIPKWKHYLAMTFLRDSVEADASLDSLAASALESSSNDEYLNTDVDGTIAHYTSEQQKHNSEAIKSTEAPVRNNADAKGKKRKLNDANLDEVRLDVFNKVNTYLKQITVGHDGEYHFGMFCAAQMRKIPSGVERERARMEIQSVLLNYLQ